MPVKIFVGNLPAGISNEDIQALFEQYGTVTECAVLGSFGFVHMLRDLEARNAIAALNRFDLYGSQIRVELSVPATQGKMKSAEAISKRNETVGISTLINSSLQQQSQLSLRLPGFEKHDAENTMTGHVSRGLVAKEDQAASVKIFVGNLKNGITDVEVREIFEQYGTVTEAAVIAGYGFVHMANVEEAKSAIKDLNGFKLGGQPISVELSTKDTQGKSKVNDSAPHQLDRPRGGAGWGGFRGRGRGIASTRFDPYATHGGAASWLGRTDPYGVGGVDIYPVSDVYTRQSMLPAPPPVLRMGPSVVSAASTAASVGGDDASFARDLLKLYTDNPAAFDAYARDPVVRRNMKLDAQEQMLASGYEETGLAAPREFYQETRLPQSRLVTPVMMSAYSGGIVRRGGLGLGPVPRSSGQIMGYRPGQSQLYMSFE